MTLLSGEQTNSRDSPVQTVQIGSTEMIVLEPNQIRRLVSMEAAIHCVRDAFIALARGEFDHPPRLSSADDGFLCMVARKSSSKETVVKAVTISPSDGHAKSPRIQSVAIWFDGASGKPKGILDGACLTAIRTGAASGVATDLLASPDSKILCMIGSGAQAPDQIDAVCSVRDIQEIRIFSRNLETAEVLARSVANSRPNVKVEVADSVRAALADADVVCCATTSVRPLVFLDDLKSNVHINAIGAHTHSMCELDTQVLVKSRILLVDSIEAAMREAGDIVRALEAGLISQDHVSELGQFLINPGDTPSSGLTVFKSVGIAAQDWAIASFAIARVLSESQFQFDHLSPAPNGI